MAIFLILPGCSKNTRSTVKTKNTKKAEKLRLAFLDDIPGQYVYYYDTRGGNKRLTGILKYSNKEFVIRTVDLRSKHVTVAVCDPVITKDNEIELRPRRQLEDDINKDMPYIMVDFYNISARYKEVKSKLLKKSVVKVKDKWPEFGYTLEHKFVD